MVDSRLSKIEGKLVRLLSLNYYYHKLNVFFIFTLELVENKFE